MARVKMSRIKRHARDDERETQEARDENALESSDTWQDTSTSDGTSLEQGSAALRERELADSGLTDQEMRRAGEAEALGITSGLEDRERGTTTDELEAYRDRTHKVVDDPDQDRRDEEAQEDPVVTANRQMWNERRRREDELASTLDAIDERERARQEQQRQDDEEPWYPGRRW